MADQVLVIYQTIAQAISDSIPEEWERAVMVFEKQADMVKSEVGFYTDETDYLKPFTIKNEVRKKAARGVYDLHAITTAGGHNRWNFLWVALLPNGAYEIDFVWSQEEADTLTHLAHTQASTPLNRSADLRAFKRGQVESRAPQLYALLARELTKLIPEQWLSASLTLHDVGNGILEHHAFYCSPGAETEDKFFIAYSWPVLFGVKELLRLKAGGGHPDWQQVAFQLTAAGTYHILFTSQSATEDASATGYTFEGQWLVPDGAASRPA